MNPLQIFKEIAENGFVFSLAVSCNDQVDYAVTFHLVQAEKPITTVVSTPEQAAVWLQNNIMLRFPESDYGKRLLQQLCQKADSLAPKH